MKTAKKPLASEVPSRELADEATNADRQAFERQRTQLMRRYAGKFVAILKRRVVDSDVDDEALARRLFERCGNVPFYIARVEDTPSIYEFPSPEAAD